MKIILFLFCIAACSVFAVPVELIDGKYPRFFDYEDEVGIIHKVDLLEPVDTVLLDEIQRNPANNEYHLFTRLNPTSGHLLIFNNESSINSSNFNPKHPTIVIAHGWLSNHKSNLNPFIRDEYLRIAESNVIVMDWRKLAKMSYTTAVKGVPHVGRGLGQFINILNKVTGAPIDTMHLIGFSLGSHLVGNAGRELGGRVARITGLDPAGPLWGNNDNRICSTDGLYVEAIHTNGGLNGLGIGSAVANADFFPNGGRSQPGCFRSTCHHNRAWELFAATVTRDHLAGVQCTNMQQVQSNKCSGSALNMGNPNLNKTGSGLFRVNTAKKYPF